MASATGAGERNLPGFNPNTLIRVYNAFRDDPNLHILQIAAQSGCWPSTIYKVLERGFLKRVDTAYYAPTERLRLYVVREEWSKK